MLLIVIHSGFVYANRDVEEYTGNYYNGYLWEMEWVIRSMKFTFFPTFYTITNFSV